MSAPSAVAATLAELLDIRAIEQAIIAFGRAMDARDWAAVLAILADDATAELGTGPLADPAAIVALMRRYLDRCGTSQHLVGSIVVTLDGDTATSRAYVHDSHLAAGDPPDAVFYSLGDYEDAWRCQDGRWRLVRRVKHNRASAGPLSVFGSAQDTG